MSTVQERDILKELKVNEIKCLDAGWVRVVECMPRIVPQGYGLEASIVKSARTSTGNGLRTVAEDRALVRYLYRKQHTSPFEAAEVQFEIKCPLFVATHFIRHRTANVNQFSARYAQVPAEFFSPLKSGIRTQSKVNKQSSEEVLDLKAPENSALQGVLVEADSLSHRLIELYETMVASGVSKELARAYLPQGMYTVINFKLDVHNLLKMLRLRMAPEAQYETRVFAIAMFNLMKPLCPWVCEDFENFTWNSVNFSRDECFSIAHESPNLLEPKNQGKPAKSLQDEYRNKVKSINLDVLLEKSDFQTLQIQELKNEIEDIRNNVVHRNRTVKEANQ